MGRLVTDQQVDRTAGADEAGRDGPLNKHELRTARSTNALLEAAADLIVEGGFDALTFTAIGERAGYSRGMVTARFGSKGGLIDALIERIVTTWSHRNVLPRTKGRTGLDGVLIMIDAIRAQAARNPRGLIVLYSLMFEAISDEELRDRFASLNEAMRRDFAGFVRAGQRDGTVRKDRSAPREAVLLLAGLRGIGYQWLLDLDGFDPVKALKYLHDTTQERLAS